MKRCFQDFNIFHRKGKRRIKINGRDHDKRELLRDWDFKRLPLHSENGSFEKSGRVWMQKCRFYLKSQTQGTKGGHSWPSHVDEIRCVDKESPTQKPLFTHTHTFPSSAHDNLHFPSLHFSTMDLTSGLWLRYMQKARKFTMSKFTL